MRALLLLLLVGILGVLAPCQEKKATIVLESGAKVVGLVKSLDKDNLILIIEGEEVSYATAQIARCVFEDLEVAGGEGEDGTPAGAPGHPGSDPAKGHGSEPAADSRVTGSSPMRRLWDARMKALDRRFPWLFPAEPMQWISLGIMLFALLSLAVHFSARIAATDHLGFGRGTALGVWFLISGVLQIAMVPGSMGGLAIVVAGNSIVAILLFRIAYGLQFGAGFVALLLLGIQGGIGFALLLLVDATLRSIGNATY